MIKIFDKCPACGGTIIVTECECTNCQLEMRGEFQLGRFATLSEDQLTFVQVFLRARGNLTEVEKVLGVSYPTIRNKLDEINTTLDRTETSPTATPGKRENPADSPTSSIDEARRTILQQVSTGELSATDAIQKIQNLRGGK